MRGIAILLLAGALAACGHEPTAPGTPQPQGLRANAATELTGPGAFGGAAMRGVSYVRLLRRLPGNLALTDQQKQTIKGYVQAFGQATKSDRQALAALLKQARDARQAGQTPDQVKAILQQGAGNRQNIQAAAAQLKQQVAGVLTSDQQAWIVANAPKACDRASAPRLSDEQKEQIKALVTSFRTANQPDLTAVRTALQQARAARKNGATAEQVKAILDPVRPSLERLRTARQALAAQIQALLTPDQKASGCYAPGFGVNRAGGLRGQLVGGRRG